MERYDHQQIEKKWQKFWQDKKTYQTKADKTLSASRRFYCLDMFPYPSGEGLHVGHVRGYTATDVYSRYMRLKGRTVLHPIGWDAFGLPAENYAIQNNIHPKKAVKRNIARFKRQIQSFGFSYDWDREINTTDPEYYKWTQWIFLKMFKRGLAYEDEAPINWCPSCKTGLANEEVTQGRCERCKTPVGLKKIRQWHLKITAYADRLLEGLGDLDWPESIKLMQKNWIGKSHGLEEEWQVEGMDLKLKTFTTSPHTSWGSTFMVIAPEHPVINKLVEGTRYEKGAKEFAKKVIQDKIRDPKNIEKVKEGFYIGRKVINHLSKRKMPLYIANFAVYDYGTGIVKCTPAHDQRDFEFAKQYGLGLIPVINPRDKRLDPRKMTRAYTGEGKMTNAGKFNGLSTSRAGKVIGDYTVKQGNGRWVVNYKLRDWVFSRQRYWGEPIPIVHCENCGTVAVPEEDLPVELPEVDNYKPSGTGESPLTEIEDWVNTECPKCGGPAERETNTMPQWAGSCWYYLRYIDPHNSASLVDKQKEKDWMAPARRSSKSAGGVDLYVGGAEHAVLHLLYARFWHKVLYDEKVVSTQEPFQKLINVGMILAPDGQKMSKSRGNVINPEGLIEEYGADSLRLYELFLGPFSQAVVWNKQGIIGMRRFLDRVWQMQMLVKSEPNPKLKQGLGKIVKEVAQDIEKFSFNTAIAKMMGFVNQVFLHKKIGREQFKTFLVILSPFAPHVTAELWTRGNKGMIEDISYPEPVRIESRTKVVIPIQINGRLRAQIKADTKTSREEIIGAAKNNQKIRKYLEGKKIIKSIYVPLKIINFVIK
jgi:leucyl-tRNA synthetase